MTEQDAATFADTVMRTQSRLLANTFVPLDARDIRDYIWRFFRVC